MGKASEQANARLSKNIASRPATGVRETAAISRANGVDKYRDSRRKGSNNCPFCAVEVTLAYIVTQQN